MKHSITCAIAVAAMAMLGSGAAYAKTSSTKTHHAKASSDRTFVQKAAEGGLAEVEFGRLATQKAGSNDVKQFGQRMVDDHSKANDQLKPIAERDGVTIPTELKGKDKAEYNRLSKLSGAQFDRAYMRMMVSDHRKDVAEFRKESTSGKNDDVKQFASATLPTLEDHLKLAQSTAGATATSGSGRTHAKGTTGTAPSGTTTPGAAHK